MTNSIVGLGDLTKPATVLIEKVSEAIGGLFAPFQTIRMAKANATAAIIEADANVRVTEIQRRAAIRLIEEETKRQENIENIVRGALPELSDQSRPDSIDEDWITNFFKNCRIVGDKEMQRVFSKILAGEANKPGSFSRKTINLMPDIGKVEAEMFQKFCSFVWTIDNMHAPVILDEKEPVYARTGLNYDMLIDLESLGLVKVQLSIGDFGLGHETTQISAQYFGHEISIESTSEQPVHLSVGKVIFTKAGQELCRIMNAEEIEGVFEYTRDYWKSSGFTIKETGDQKAIQA